MKKSIFLAVFLSLLFQCCQPLPDRVGSIAKASPRPSNPTSLGPETDQPARIPLAVGHGMDGGWYQLYFTDPSDPAADQLDGGPDGPLVDALDSAQLTIDAAIYSFTLNSVRRALIHAHQRGVKVRIVMESDNMDGYNPQAVKDAGIPMLGDRRPGLMHNKFVIIDRSEVWTGSMNLTNDGTYSDRNNLLRIRSSEVAEDYESEFNEMFVEDKFGPDLGRITPHPHVNVDGTPLEIYFSPDDNVQPVLLKLLKNAKSSIYFLAFSFTADPLGDAILERASSGLHVSGVMDKDQVRSNTGTEYDTFRVAGLDVRLDGEHGLMHHKVMIIDGETVVMGSYNFTAAADKTNDENLIVIHNPVIAAQYYREFQRIYALATPP